MQISQVSRIWPSGYPGLFILNTRHNTGYIFCPGSFGYCKPSFIPIYVFIFWHRNWVFKLTTIDVPSGLQARNFQSSVIHHHYPICFDITCPKPHKPSKIIQFRKWSNLDLEHFKSKLSSSSADSTATSDVNTMVDVYNQTLKSCLDDLLPVRSKTITEHFNCPYYNDEIRAAKQRRRKLEKQWLKSRSDHHRALYVNQCKLVTTLLKKSKAEYYQTKVIECKKDQKALFRVLNEHMHRNNDNGNEIANGIPCDDLAERLNHYFIEKIDHIRDHLVNTPDHPVVPSSPLFSLSAFKHVTEKAVEKAVQSRPSKHCPLDPIPTWLLKNSIDILTPCLTELVNQSLNNIAFLSKLLESLACEQYVDHLKKM